MCWRKTQHRVAKNINNTNFILLLSCILNDFVKIFRNIWLKHCGYFEVADSDWENILLDYTTKSVYKFLKLLQNLQQ